MSSTASNFGFPELEAIAAVLVRAADEKAHVNAGDVLEDFADCLVGLSADVKKNLSVQ